MIIKTKSIKISAVYNLATLYMYTACMLYKCKELRVSLHKCTIHGLYSYVFVVVYLYCTLPGLLCDTECTLELLLMLAGANRHLSPPIFVSYSVVRCHSTAL